MHGQELSSPHHLTYNGSMGQGWCTHSYDFRDNGNSCKVISRSSPVHCCYTSEENATHYDLNWKFCTTKKFIQLSHCLDSLDFVTAPLILFSPPVSCLYDLCTQKKSSSVQVVYSRTVYLSCVCVCPAFISSLCLIYGMFLEWCHENEKWLGTKIKLSNISWC